MELSFEEKMDLLWCVCAYLANEREKYSWIKDMSEEEIQDFRKEFKIKVELNKEMMKSNIERLEKLKGRLKEETK